MCHQKAVPAAAPPLLGELTVKATATAGRWRRGNGDHRKENMRRAAGRQRGGLGIRARTLDVSSTEDMDQTLR